MDVNLNPWQDGTVVSKSVKHSEISLSYQPLILLTLSIMHLEQGKLERSLNASFFDAIYPFSYRMVYGFQFLLQNYMIIYLETPAKILRRSLTKLKIINLKSRIRKQSMDQSLSISTRENWVSKQELVLGN